MTWFLVCNGDLEDVDVGLVGGSMTVGAGARITRSRLSAAGTLVLSGDATTTVDGLDVTGNTGASLVLVPGSGQSVRGLVIDPGSGVDTAIDVTGDGNVIDVVAHDVPQDAVEISGDRNTVRMAATMAAGINGLGTGALINGAKNDVRGTVNKTGVNDYAYGVSLTAPSADNFTCVRANDAGTAPYLDAGTNNEYCSTGPHLDPDAIHTNVADEIHQIPVKATPVAADVMVLEDSADGWAKKQATVGSLPGGGGSSPLTTKGDVFVYDVADTRLPVGGEGSFLRATALAAPGLAWAVPDHETELANVGTNTHAAIDTHIADEPAAGIASHAGIAAAHHLRYTDSEAIAAVGPHFSGAHPDLSAVTADQHHPRDHAATHSQGAADPVDVINLAAAGVAGYIPQRDGAGGLTWIVTPGGGGGSPLTTKGDLYTFDVADARLPVGAAGYLLIADAAEPTGLRWTDTMSIDLYLGGNDMWGVVGIGDTSITERIEFQGSAMRVYDASNAERFVIFDSGDVVVRANDGVSIVWAWDETENYMEMQKDLNLAHSLSKLRLAGSVAPDDFRIWNSGDVLRVDDWDGTTAVTRLEVHHSDDVGTPGDLVFKNVVGADILRWDQSVGQWDLGSTPLAVTVLQARALSWTVEIKDDIGTRRFFVSQNAVGDMAFFGASGNEILRWNGTLLRWRFAEPAAWLEGASVQLLMVGDVDGFNLRGDGNLGMVLADWDGAVELDRLRIQHSDAGVPGDILWYAVDGSTIIMQWDESAAHWISTSLEIGSVSDATADLTAYGGGVAGRTLLGNFGAHIYASGIAQGVTSSTTFIQFNNTVRDDTGTMVDLANNRIYAPVTGWYKAEGNVRWGAIASGVGGLRIYKNAAIQRISQLNAAGVSLAYHPVECSVHMTAGDYVQLAAVQTAGGTVNLNDGSVWEVALKLVAVF